MKYLIISVVLAVFAVAVLQCKKSDAPEPSANNFSCDDHPAACDLTASNGVFAIDLFKKLQQDEADKNIFFSPFSISTALTMTANGAKSQTLEDMRNALRLTGLSMESVNESYKLLLEAMPNLDPKVKLKLANSIWHEANYPVLQSFLKINTDYFNSEIIPVQFKDPAIIAKVNKWVEDKTDGLIKNAVDQLPPDVVMLLINAIYFKGTWKTSFDPENTTETDFFAPDETVKVDMMHIPESDFGYFSNDLFQAIDLPYGNSVFSMSIFLPKEGYSVDEFIATMNPTSWDNWLSAFQLQPVQLFLPKFKMEYEKRLKRTLSDMGMEVAFTDRADFSSMINGGGVLIDDVIHKAFVEVDEAGTKAAAVTVVVIVNTSAGSGPPTVNVNRPFVFVIRDNKTNSILFMGKVLNPTAS